MLDKSGSSTGRSAAKEGAPKNGAPKNGGEASADRASLTYVTDTEPGIRRFRTGRGFSYKGPDGQGVDENTMARIKALAIPPAWTDVWISPVADGHIQATGRDQRGRKQYRYHPQWAEERDGVKYSSLVAFAES
ncbi:MAG: DNA topoisomerase IB, partial [Mesorhizobium sp.]